MPVNSFMHAIPVMPKVEAARSKFKVYQDLVIKFK